MKILRDSGEFNKELFMKIFPFEIQKFSPTDF
jgi:hypothetical protein